MAGATACNALKTGETPRTGPKALEHALPRAPIPGLAIAALVA